MATHSGAEQAPDEDDDDEAEQLLPGTSFLLFNAVPSWLTSMIVHIVLLIVLAFITLRSPLDDALHELYVGDANEMEEIEDFDQDDMPEIQVESPNIEITELTTVNAVPETPVITPADDLDTAAIMVDLEALGERTAPKNDLLASLGTFSGTGLTGRGARARATMVRDGGGTPGSEAAVALALEWLANHQQQDGGWSFDHRASRQCQGQCPDQGNSAAARNGATAMALLPFLGAGKTHKEGNYKQVVQRGLYFLVSRQRQANKGLGSLWEDRGQMYSHGLAAIALCEAYGMTKDRKLMGPAQLSLNFISAAQDPGAGGWRYNPQDAGDTSVVGWQLMALKSGHMAYLVVDPETVAKANQFLDSVQAESGAVYGYTGPGNGQATSAIGLLCRMYLGWRKDHGPLQHGAQRLAEIGPSTTNMYYNYYATQVMRHMGGEKWKTWNTTMRDYLVERQNKEGHTKGSWIMNDAHRSHGGRVYCTSLATMILEVYYRHMPIYQQQAAEDDFRL